MKTYRIAFDVRPGNAGPARYVASLARALSSPEWSVQYIDRSCGELPSNMSNSTTDFGDRPRFQTSSHGIRRKLGHCVPPFVRTLAGFRRDAKVRVTDIRRVPCDLIHIQNTGCEEMAVAARYGNVPHILGTFHVDSTIDLDGVRSGFVHRCMEWYSNRSLDLAIAVSEATKQDWIRRSRIPANRVVTIHNGIDPDQFVRQQSRAEARRLLGIPPESVVVGGLGRLDHAKGFTYLLDAASMLQQEFPQLLVAIAGRGPLRDELEGKARALGLGGRVLFLGFQADVNLVLDACDIFVLPSLCEALPFALLEAMAHELPAVGTTVGGVPEVIIPGETGFLCPPRDGTALAKALRPLIESAELRERMGRAGRERVIKHFHEADMVRKTLDVYREMLANRLMATGERR